VKWICSWQLGVEFASFVISLSYLVKFCLGAKKPPG
jgi:hypothetical protein